MGLIGGPYGKYIFNFIKHFQSRISKRRYNCAFPPAKYEIPFLLVLGIIVSFCLLVEIIVILLGVQRCIILVLTCISLMTNDTSIFSNVYMPLFTFFSSKHFCPFKKINKAFLFLLLKYENPIHIWIEVFCELCNLQMLHLSLSLAFQDLNSMFQEVFNFDKVQL